MTQTARQASLASLIKTAPRLIDAEAARSRVADWLAGLPAGQATPIKSLLAAYPVLATLTESLAESSPYLWELASLEPLRFLKLLQSDPDRHFAALLEGIAETMQTADDLNAF